MSMPVSAGHGLGHRNDAVLDIVEFGLGATSGTMTSGIGALPVRLATSAAASKMARACISAISG